MFVNEVNDVKIYNLSAGKSVPDVSKLKMYLGTGLIALLLAVAHRQAQAVSADEEGRLPASDRAHPGL